MINHIIIKPGPSVADPSDVIKATLVNHDGTLIHISAPAGWRGWQIRFLVWAIRKLLKVRNNCS